MVSGMCFIYSLTHKEQIFYIGKTKHVANRYRAHLNSIAISNTRTSQFIKTLLDANEYPELHIMDYLPEKEATKMEYYLIRVLSKAGQPLTNYLGKWDIFKDPKNAPTTKNKSAMIKIAKYKQDAHLYQFIQSKNYWKEPIIIIKDVDYPDNPFTNE